MFVAARCTVCPREIRPSRKATNTAPISGRAGCERAATRRAREMVRREFAGCGRAPARGNATARGIAAARGRVAARGIVAARGTAVERDVLRRPGRAPAGSGRAAPNNVTGRNRRTTRTRRARPRRRRLRGRDPARTRRRPGTPSPGDRRAGARGPRAGDGRRSGDDWTDCGGSCVSLLGQFGYAVWLCGQAPGGAQQRAACPGISCNFVGARTARLGPDGCESGGTSADTHRPLGGTEPPPPLLLDEPLDDPILE